MTTLHLNQWDEVRFEALKRRVDTYWKQYNEIYGNLPTSSTDEKARLRAKLDEIKQELCEDFREMIRISENVLGVALGDHYSLYTVCGQ
jgi:hypothetical protein